MLRFFAVALISLLGMGSAQATLINQGESFTVSFDGVALETRGSESRNYGIGSLFFGDNQVEVGESVKLEFFEDRPGGALLYASVFDGPTGSIGATLPWPSVWQDLQGVIRLTVIQGSVDLIESWVMVGKDGDLYSERWRYPSAAASVAEPNAILMFLMALLATFWLYARRASHPRPRPTR